MQSHISITLLMNTKSMVRKSESFLGLMYFKTDALVKLLNLINHNRIMKI